MKYLAVLSVFLVSSCSWLDGMQDWANTNMPTYDGSRPGLTAKPEEPAPTMPGYKNSTAVQAEPAKPSSSIVPQTAPGQSNVNSAVPAPKGFNAATVPTSMPVEPDYYDPVTAR